MQYFLKYFVILKLPVSEIMKLQSLEIEKQNNCHFSNYSGSEIINYLPLKIKKNK